MCVKVKLVSCRFQLEVVSSCQLVVWQAEGASKATVAVGQMRHLAAVVDTFPLPAGSAEMDLVYSGLAGFLGYQDRKTLHEAYQQVSSSPLSARAVAEALGMAK